MSVRNAHCDLAIVGGGIVGLACALAASRRGWRVIVVDRERAAIGASIRNFGFVTVTGQQAGLSWQRALRSREVWAEVCAAARIPILQRGLLLVARRAQACAVLEQFLDTPMGDGLERLTAGEARARAPVLRVEGARLIVHSPHELRVEAREALPMLARFLQERHQVEFLWDTTAIEISPGRLHTSAGTIAAPRIAVCPGPDIRTLFPEVFRAREVVLCKLQMTRLAPLHAVGLPSPVMGDLSFARYPGYAELSSARALQRVLERECPGELANGIHLIVVQSADGTLVVGDSHHYDPSPDPFAPAQVEDLMLAEMHRNLHLDGARVIERWTGLYPSAAGPCFVHAPAAEIRVVSVTSGTGMSTGFALGEEVVQSWD